MGKIKLFHVITGLAPGGAERLVLDMIQMYDREKFDVELISIVSDSRALEVYGYNDQSIIVFDMKSLKKLPIALYKFVNYIKQKPPDIIHAHMFHSMLVSVFACKITRSDTKICFTSHNSQFKRIKKYVIYLLKKYRDTDIIFKNKQHNSINAKNTIIVYNGVKVEKNINKRNAWNANGKVKLLFVGSLTDQKNPKGLLEMFHELNMPNVVLNIVGTGTLEDSLKELTKDLKIQERVIFHGLSSNVRNIMKSCDIFVMYSKYEGMPIAILEAGAEAMPVVSTPVGSVPEILDNKRGWVVDSLEYINVLKYVIKNPEIGIDYGNKLYHHILKKHSIQSITKKHENVYLGMINK